ncbi:MAG: hydroxymethylbilane synthase, partial [Candidatus Omnitrophica bacterium]|nr:hydroxymethylbilane synthase [Candidatus Omnitrophota bacterium]
VKLTLRRFSYDEMLPACGQGALGIMAREGDEATCRLLDGLNDAKAHSAVSAERAFLKKLGGGCQIPIGALAEVRANRLTLRGGVFSLDGRRSVKGKISGNKKDACELGEKLAKKLLSKGAGSIIKGAK